MIREMAQGDERQGERGDGALMRRLGFGAVGVLVLVFAAMVGWVSLAVRGDIRRQFMARDAYVLNLMVQNEIAKAEDERLVFSFERLGSEDLWESLLETASAPGVFAARLFGIDGTALFATGEEGLARDLGPEALAAARRGETYAVYFPDGELEEFGALAFGDERRFEALAVFVPLRSGRGGELLGIAKFLLDGRALAGELALLDGRLARQAGVALGVGGVSILAVFGFAWRRLEASKVALASQAKRLRQANVELALLARTSAVGSIAAHLIHGLKNPLAGLRQVASARKSGDAGSGAEDWADASEAAERMQRMVQEVVALLQDSAAATGYEMEVEELEGEVRRRFEAVASSLGIVFEVERVGSGGLEAHRANMALLIVTNLVQNALDAVGPGDCVRVFLASDGRRLVVTVRDTGPGIDPGRREELFAPVQTSKSGGAGIGLAISKQLALHIGATLRYLDTRGQGALFELDLPLLAEEASN